MEVRAKKALGQHFLTDLSIAQRIAEALIVPCPGIDTVNDAENPMPALEVGPGMGVLTQYVLQRPEVDLRMVEIDTESVDYLLVHFPQVNGKLIEADFLKLKLESFFPGKFCVIGNFPYNISSQIFFKILDYKESVPQVVCMIQKEVAERIAEKPGTKTYGILSVLLQAWYDIEYLFTVGEGAFNPPPKVKSAVIRLVRNQRTSLGCDETLFKTVVKTGFNQRRKTLRNSLKPLIRAKAGRQRTKGRIAARQQRLQLLFGDALVLVGFLCLLRHRNDCLLFFIHGAQSACHRTGGLLDLQRLGIRESPFAIVLFIVFALFHPFFHHG